MSKKLKRCPFCKHEDPEVERLGTSRQSCIVICGWCGCRLESNEMGAGSSWNNRPIEDALLNHLKLGVNLFGSMFNGGLLGEWVEDAYALINETETES